MNENGLKGDMEIDCVENISLISKMGEPLTNTIRVTSILTQLSGSKLPLSDG